MSVIKSKMNYGAALKKNMYERKDTYAMVEAAVSKDGMMLANVKHQTNRITWLAVHQNWRALQFVQEINASLVHEAVIQSAEAGTLIPQEFHFTAVIANINCFDFLRRPYLQVCQYVLKEKPDWIAKFKNPSLELCMQVVKHRHRVACNSSACTIPSSCDKYLGVGYFEGMPITEELAREALQPTQGCAWRSMPASLQSRYDLEALRLNSFPLKFMEHTPARLMAVIDGNPWRLRGMEQTPELAAAACRAHPPVLEIVKNPSRELVWQCAVSWADAIQYAKEQDLELCVHAVKHHIAALRHVKLNRLQVCALAGKAPSMSLLFPQYAKYIGPAGSISHKFFLNIALQCRDNPMIPAEDMEDPITLAPVEPGTLVAIIKENGKQHFAGTWESLWRMMMTGFRGSCYSRIFVPIKNSLVSASQIQWRLAA